MQKSKLNHSDNRTDDNKKTKKEDDTPVSEKDNNDSAEENTTTRKRKRKEEESHTEEKTSLSPKKLQRVVKSGEIGDKVLMGVAWEITDKWNEVGVSLSIGFKILQSTIGSLGTIPDHMKAFHMLQEWKARAAENYTYQTLASALEENGLRACALKFCYTGN